MTRDEYIEWYKDHYQKDPPVKLLEKYYPKEQDPKDDDLEDLLS